MILIISTCNEKISELEFVEPLKKLVGDSEIIHYKSVQEKDILAADKIIISGTALKDFEYLHGDFQWLLATNKPVLGICAGMQIIAQTFKISLVDKCIIGVRKVTVTQENKLCKWTFDAYFMHTKIAVQGFIILAKTEEFPCIVKHPSKEIYGCVFHPEVMNQEIIENFVRF